MPISSFSIFGDKIAIGTRTEVVPDRWSNRVYIADTKNGKTIDIIEPPEFQEESVYPLYRNFNVHLDSFRDLLVIIDLDRDWNNFAYLLSSDNHLQKIPFDLEEMSNFDNKKHTYCQTRSVDLSKGLLVTGCYGSPFGTLGTFFFKDFPQPTLTEHYLSGGIIDAKQPDALITWAPIIYASQYNHLLLKRRDGKTINESLIGWSSNVNTRSSIRRSKGVIGEQDLFLSAEDGRVVRLPIKGLPSSYKIEQNICGE